MRYNVNFEDIGLKDYKEIWDYQAQIFKQLVENKISAGMNPSDSRMDVAGKLIFVEHPHVYTIGKNGSETNLLVDLIQLKVKNAAFYRTDRGGDITYHGPGQLVGYPIFDLGILRIGLKEYIFKLEEAVIKTLKEFGVAGARLEGSTGVWIDPGNEGERKICAIGVKASRYITMHGFALNVNTDLSYFENINPCGFRSKGVTSLERELCKRQDFNNVKGIIRRNIREIFDLVWTK